MRSNIVVLLAAVAATSMVGCAKARHVEVTQQGGVVAIPSNTNSWPSYYRNQAEELIRQKCPNGYEIVQEEELVTGKVAHTNSRTKTERAPTLDLGRFHNDAEESEGSSTSLAGLSVPLGKTREETNETTDYTDMTEYRIYYRPKSP
jgi:hypothetical protein